MEQSPRSEDDNHSAYQESPIFLWNPKIHCHVQKNLVLDPVLSQINSVLSLELYLSNTEYNNILSSSPRCIK
jgi:hypothetical protein